MQVSKLPCAPLEECTRVYQCAKPRYNAFFEMLISKTIPVTIGKNDAPIKMKKGVRAKQEECVNVQIRT
jgi:hypothetical protein